MLFNVCQVDHTSILFHKKELKTFSIYLEGGGGCIFVSG